MLKAVINFWYLFILSMLVGAFLYAFNYKRTKAIFNLYNNKAPLIKKYWLFTIPFLVCSIIIFVVILKFSSEDKTSLNISIAGQGLTLIFAIYVGYLAFLQLVENRLDKLKELGDSYLIQKSYLRAIEYYQEAFKIKPTDYSVLANLLELYLIGQNFSNFEERLPLLEKNAIEEHEKIIPLYLKAVKSLFKQYITDAKEEIKDCLDFIKKHPNSLEHLIWNFDDIRSSPVYKALEGETKIIMDNFIRYLQRELNDEEKKKFESGNYLLSELPK